MLGRIKDIENHLERYEARRRKALIEAIETKRALYRRVIKLNAGIIAILCAVYAV